MSVSSDYRLGFSEGDSTAGRTQMDETSAKLVLLALVEKDPSVTVELSLPPTRSGDYTRGYVAGWQRRMVATAKDVTGE